MEIFIDATPHGLPNDTNVSCSASEPRQPAVAAGLRLGRLMALRARMARFSPPSLALWVSRAAISMRWSATSTRSPLSSAVAGLSPLPIARTVRVAETAADVAGRLVSAGTPIHLEIGTAGLWFGAGPHACPGQILAETIANATVSSIVAFGAAVEADAIELDADHRPVAVWLDLGRRT